MCHFLEVEEEEEASWKERHLPLLESETYVWTTYVTNELFNPLLYMLAIDTVCSDIFLCLTGGTDSAND